jgi:hypothetical protein
MSLVRRLSPNQRLYVLAFLLYLPFIFMGYGSDVDSYRVLDAGRNFFATADYVPSRRPGYLVHEMLTLLFNSVGGSLLSNLATLAFALLALYSFLRICQHFHLPEPLLLGLGLAFHPAFWTNAAATIDYVWALAFLLTGFWLLLDDKFNFGGLALGLAVGTRLSLVLSVVLVLIFVFVTRREQRKYVLGAALVAGLVSGAAYILPMDFVGWNLKQILSLFKASVGDESLWTSSLRLGRFAYKNLYFWGLPAAALLIACLVFISKRLGSILKDKNAALFGLAAAVILVNEVLFFKYPIEMDYLLPTLPFWLILIGIGLAGRRKILIALVILVMLTNFVNFNIARPDVPSQASSATYGFWVEEGVLLKETGLRLELLDCDARECYNSVGADR